MMMILYGLTWLRRTTNAFLSVLVWHSLELQFVLAFRSNRPDSSDWI